METNFTVTDSNKLVYDVVCLVEVILADRYLVDNYKERIFSDRRHRVYSFIRYTRREFVKYSQKDIIEDDFVAIYLSKSNATESSIRSAIQIHKIINDHEIFISGNINEYPEFFFQILIQSWLL